MQSIPTLTPVPRRPRPALLAASLILLLGVAQPPLATAADRDAPAAGSAPARSDTTRAMNDMRASKLMGAKVRSPQGEDLGKIDDLVIDVNNQRVAYAILSFGGALGLGDKRFAYPLAVFQPAPGRPEQLVLNVEKEKLQAAPGFERHRWPNWNESTGYRSEVARYFGPTISPRVLPNEKLARASELVGKDVEDTRGKNAGEIQDLVVNLSSAKVHYAVLDFDRSWTTRDVLVPLPLQAFRFGEKRSDDMVLTMNKGDIDLSHSFPKGRWPDIGNPSYQRDIDGYLERTASGQRSPGPAGPLRNE